MLCRIPPALGTSKVIYETRCCDSLDYDTCCGYPQFTESCPIGQIRCGDGVCRAPEECVNGVNCPPEYPYRCAGNICVSDPLQCLDTPSCLNGWVRCENGQCAPSHGDCVMITTRHSDICTEDQPVLCADGICRRTLQECDLLGPCPDTFPYRCPDNSCVTSKEKCGFRNTCPSSTQKRCESGRNVGVCFEEDEADCDDSSICPVDMPVL